MAEIESLEGKNLALEQKFQEMINYEISNAKMRNQDEATIALNDGRGANVVIKIKKDDSSDEYKIAIEGENEKKYSLATVNPKGIYSYRLGLSYIDIATPEFSFADAIDAYLVKKELEEAKKDGRVEPIRMGREITEGEAFSELANRMFGEKVHEAYRVRGKDSHSFKYIGINNAGKYVEFGGSSEYEGSNPNQKVYILTTNGKLEEKTVDHLTTNGKYAIATDIPDSAIADRTRTLVGNRLPSGRYLFIEALDSRNAEASNNKFVKELLTRGESHYDMEDIADALELAQKIRGLNSDGVVTAEELEFVVKLKEKGYNADEINDFINTVHDLKEQGLDNAKIRAILDSVETTAEQIEEIEKANLPEEKVLEVFERMYDPKNGYTSLDKALLDVKDDNNKSRENTDEGKEGRETDEKVRGHIPTIPEERIRHYN